MIRRQFFAISTTIVLGLALALAPTAAIAQQKSMRDQLLGAWTILIVDAVNQDGTQTPLFGPNPNGTAIFDGSGRYAVELSRSNMAPFAANDRMKGTPEENKAAVEGSLAHSGTFDVDENAKELTFHIRGSSFPNWQGTHQKRPFEILGADDMQWKVPVNVGSGVALLIWHRVK